MLFSGLFLYQDIFFLAATNLNVSPSASMISYYLFLALKLHLFNFPDHHIYINII